MEATARLDGLQRRRPAAEGQTAALRASPSNGCLRRDAAEFAIVAPARFALVLTETAEDISRLPGRCSNRAWAPVQQAESSALARLDQLLPRQPEPPGQKTPRRTRASQGEERLPRPPATR